MGGVVRLKKMKKTGTVPVETEMAVAGEAVAGRAVAGRAFAGRAFAC